MLGIFIISHTNSSVLSHSQHVIIQLLLELFLKVHKQLKSISSYASTLMQILVITGRCRAMACLCMIVSMELLHIRCGCSNPSVNLNPQRICHQQ